MQYSTWHCNSIQYCKIILEILLLYYKLALLKLLVTTTNARSSELGTCPFLATNLVTPSQSNNWEKMFLKITFRFPAKVGGGNLFEFFFPSCCKENVKILKLLRGNVFKSLFFFLDPDL